MHARIRLAVKVEQVNVDRSRVHCHERVAHNAHERTHAVAAAGRLLKPSERERERDKERERERA
jgi:hypothetical protein